MSRHDIAAIALGDLAESIPRGARVVGDPNALVTGITQDSRSVRGGDLFACIRGDVHDGHDHAVEAVQRGAAALIVERSVPSAASLVPRIEVEDVRAVVGWVASRAFGHPSRSLRLIGITGTNGKTSTAAIIGAITEASGSVTRVIGTLSGERTTPEAIDLHAAFRDAVSAGVDTVVMEVSSHALAQHRVDGVTFDVAVFTNLGRDHLDYHGTMEAYFAAKARLFTSHLSRAAVVNVDDPHGMLLADTADVPVSRFSSGDASDVVVGVDSVAFTWRAARISLPLGGAFMLMNSIAAVTTADAIGIPMEAIVTGCANVAPVRGRFESFTTQGGVSVIVDYAHTPEALSQLLSSVRSLAVGRVIVVFGCGGDRDRGKRPIMGDVASRLADVVIITSDNPRREDPRAIIADIEAGVSAESNRAETVVDRAEAIASAISRASRGDMVVIAGKGHESVQEIAGVTTPFDDLEVARETAAGRRKGGRA